MADCINQINPWKTTATNTIYENDWISLREDKVINPNNGEGIYGVVHFKHKAVGILPIDDNGYIYLVGQFRYPLNIYSWEIPEGGCPEHEDTLEAAQRELLEETGLKALSWQELGRAHLSNSVTDEEAILYLATDLEKGECCPEETEELAHKHIPFTEAIKMVEKGEITDSMSIIAIMRYAWLTKNEMAS